MPIDAFNRAPQPTSYEVLQAAQTIPVERLTPSQEVIDQQFEGLVTSHPDLQELATANAVTEAQEIATATNAYNIPGRQPEVTPGAFETDRPNAYRIPAHAVTPETVPESAEVRRYTAEQAKVEALNAGDAIMRVRRDALALAA